MHQRSLHQLSRWERAMHGTEEPRKLRKGKCAYNPWTHISHKELIYLLQKSTWPRSKVLLRMLLGEGLVGVNHRAIPTATQRKKINKYFMLRLLYITVHHTCVLWESQTPTHVFFNSTITQLAQLWYYYLYISKQLSSTKLILVFNALSMIVFIIPNLDAHHSRTKFTTIANTMLF